MPETASRAARTTRRTAPRATSAAAPFSPTAAKLIEQIQADARAALLVELSAKDGVIVLHGLEPETRRVSVDGDDIQITDARGSSIELWRRRFEPESWKGCSYMAGVWHPANWDGMRTLVDGAGNKWSSHLPTMVCDDFGNLVEVAK